MTYSCPDCHNPYHVSLLLAQIGELASDADNNALSPCCGVALKLGFDPTHAATFMAVRISGENVYYLSR